MTFSIQWTILEHSGLYQYEWSVPLDRIFEEIIIDRDSGIPVYRQLEKQITGLIKVEKLKSGDKLLPERELSANLGLSRGTVKKAYEELSRDGFVEIIQGKGSFVANDEPYIETGRKEQAVLLIDKLLSEMIEMRFSFKEINTLFQLLLMQRESRLGKFNIAAIDCNPEALSIFEKQILYLSRIKIYKYLLADVVKYQNPVKIFEEYDLILTTTTHYDEIVLLIQDIKERIIKTAVSPSQQTVIDLASIPVGQTVGIFCSSINFRNIIAERLRNFKISGNQIRSAFDNHDNDLGSFLKEIDFLIVPPDFHVRSIKNYQPYLQQFRERGGKIIFFEYKIQRGSLIYIEEQISNLLTENNGVSL